MISEAAKIASEVVFPSYDDVKQHEIRSTLRSLTCTLRDAYYDAAPARKNIYETPFGGPIGDSIGPWPEFILRGLPCQKSKIGCCTPCFYSRMPQVNLPENEIYNSLVGQVQYIIRNFEALVIRNQWGPVAWPEPIKDQASKPVGIVVTPTGSFFDEYEFPFKIRKEVLSILQEHSKYIQRPFALHIETHVEHFLMAARDKEAFNEIVELLKTLHARVLFGFESNNDFIRNVLYNKFLHEKTFRDAVNLARENDLPVGAFVFVGINPLNDVEVLADVFSTFEHLREREITPVVMFHNVQQYTIQELLYLYNAHELPDPRTILEVVKNLLLLFPDKPQAKIDSWLLADPVGGPPPPEFNIFSARQRCTCKQCGSSIYEAIVLLRQTRNAEIFLEEYNRLAQCKCAKEYLNLLDDQKKSTPSLLERTNQMVELSKTKCSDYISVIRPIINKVEGFELFRDNVPRYGDIFDPAVKGPELKAELLCYGLRVASDIEGELLKFNSYVHEAGFVHAAHFLIGDHIVNTCIAEDFCATSPYLLRKRDNHFEIVKNNVIVAPCEVLTAPPWCAEMIDGYRLGDILRPHSQSAISGMPKAKCCYFAESEECAFCSLGSLQSTPEINPELVAATALRAYEYNSQCELTLSGGTSDTPDRSARYFCDIASAIRKKENMPISVELVPPDENSYLDELHRAGVCAVIMNIEIWNPDLRTIFCPGKSRISRERYLDAIGYAVALFGKGQVASVLIAGIQSNADVIDGAKTLIGLGVIPTIIPFKPFNDCKMARFPCTKPADVLEIYNSVADLLIAAGLDPSIQKGCTKCGGCSLENLSKFKKGGR